MGVYVIGISGASGIILAKRAIAQLLNAGHTLHVVVSRSACCTAALELPGEFSKPTDLWSALSFDQQSRITLHSNSDFSAPVASGSFRVNGTLIIPCSMTTLGAIAAGVCDNLLRRCADVALKERFPLVIVPREAPLSAIHLENMLKLTQLGAYIFPPVPIWYSIPSDLQSLEEGIVARALQVLGVESGERYFSPWQGGKAKCGKACN